MENGRKEYNFFWFIENYSFCSNNNGEELVSPTFIVDKLEGTTWELGLYPRGDDDEARGYISLFLNRNKEDDGPEKISVNYELSFLAADGSAICIYECEEGEREFESDDGYGCGTFLKMDEVLLQRKADYLPQDVLSVRCRMWTGEGSIQHIGQSSARTRIRTEKNSFSHAVENFSALQPNVKHTIKIPSHTKKECFISSSLYFTEGVCCEEKVMIEIVPSDTDKILLRCEFCLLDESGNVIECGGTDNRYDAELKSIRTTPLSLSRKSILNRKSEYLPDDKLSLICKCTFYCEMEFEATEETINEISPAVMKKSNDLAASELHSTLSSVSEDIKSLYIDQCLTDVELKTETKTFPAHKLVLCARSPVFKAMMTNDMKEKNTDCINVDDLENDIVQQLLLFLYSDKIEDLEWENATQLYYAADKYQICKLKEVCSSFLEGYLTTTNAPELLLLADTHSDSNLKKSVEDFILKHEEEIFGSKEWDMLAGKNPQLVINTMQLKYKRKKNEPH